MLLFFRAAIDQASLEFNSGRVDAVAAHMAHTLAAGYLCGLGNVRTGNNINAMTFYFMIPTYAMEGGGNGMVGTQYL